MKELCLLFIGGEGPQSEDLDRVLFDFLGVEKRGAKDSFWVIACDSGAKLALDCNYIPDLLIGDFDSIDDPSMEFLRKEGTEMISYPCDKDDTDSQLGLAYAKARAHQVVLVGGGGGRLDHLLSLWEDMKSRHAPDLWITASDVVYLLNRFNEQKPLSVSFQIAKAIPLSLFPLHALLDEGGSPFLPLRTEGLKWDFEKLPANNHFSSQSNCCESGHFSIELFGGAVAIMSAIDSGLKRIKI